MDHTEERKPSEDDIAARWVANLEARYLEEGRTSRHRALSEQNLNVHNTTSPGPQHLFFQDVSIPTLNISPTSASQPYSPTLSQADTNFSMPSRNLSKMDSSGSDSKDTIRTLVPGIEQQLIQLGPELPAAVNIDSQIHQAVQIELQVAADGGSLSEKLTCDLDGTVDGNQVPQRQSVFPQPPRPSAINHSNRCVTPQRSNVKMQRSPPTTPRSRTQCSERYRYTYEADARSPPSPVPPFVVVHSSGVARVTTRPSNQPANLPSSDLEEIPSSGRSLWINIFLSALAAVLFLAAVTLGAGIVRAKEVQRQNNQILDSTDDFVNGWSQPPLTNFPSESGPSIASPTLQPVFSIPNEDANDEDLRIPDLSGGIIAREETLSPTTSDYVEPTSTPRTLRPTSPSIAPSMDPSSFPSDIPSIRPYNAPSMAPTATITTGNPSAKPTTNPTNAPSALDERDVLRDYITVLLENATEDFDPSVFTSTSSAQSRALEWTVSDQFERQAWLSDDRILQRFVLAATYYALNGNSWLKSTLWLSSNDECQWFTTRNGRICDNLGRLRSLELDTNKVSGNIPTELSLLELERIFLRNNYLDGEIPTEIGRMTTLKFLQLTNNELSGAIPTEIGDLSNLIVLGLGRNHLKETIPSELGSLKAVDTFGLGGNFLGGTIPTEFGQMSNLRILNLHDNDLKGPIPSQLGGLPHLQMLKLASNSLVDSMPSEICELRALELSHLSADCLEVSCPVDCCSLCCVDENKGHCD